MADEILVTRAQGNVDVQVGGPGNPWSYLSACAGLGGPTVPLGGTELRFCKDPQRAGKFKISTKIRTAPDQITLDLMTKLGKTNYLKNLNCPFTIRARFTICGEGEDTANFDPIMLSYCGAEVNEKSYEDLVAMSPDNNDEIIVTSSLGADEEYIIEKIAPARIGTATNLGDQPINDVEYCGNDDCGGACGSRSTPCSTIYAVTDSDTTPYAAPNLITGTLNLTTGAYTWTVEPILGLNSAAEGVECAGSRVIVSSNGDSVIVYNDTPTDQDTWVVVSLTNAPSANPNALFARTAQEVWVASNSGYVYKSVDGGTSWNAMHEATLTSENLNAIYAYDANLVYAVGDAGVIIKSENGGNTWTDLTETSTTGSNLLCVVVPPGRSSEVFIGTNAGQIFRSTDEGATFSAYTFTGSGVGTVDDLDFCGPCGGDVMYILHNDAGPRGRILRDLSGGNGGKDVEIVSGYTQVVAAGVELNALSCCDVNEVIAGGENVSAYPMLIKVS